MVCMLYLIKWFQSAAVAHTYLGNIKERQANHPIGTINSFLMIVFYYVCLYYYLEDIDPTDSCTMGGNKDLVNYFAVFIALDCFLMIISFIFIAKVKAKSQELITNKRFKEYNTEAEIALGDILYLPQEFESDDNEDEF